MTPLFTLIDGLPSPLWPANLLGWAGWFIFMGVLYLLVMRWRKYAPRAQHARWVTIGLLVLVPLTSLFLGVRFPAGEALPLPGVTEEPRGPALMLLAALPWMLAGGFLGPLASAGLALFAGFLRFLWDTRSIFTPLEFAIIGVLFGTAMNQRYRTLFFRALRQPLVTVVGLVGLYGFIFILASFFYAPGSIAARVDYALTRAGGMTLAIGGELLIAGIFAQVFASAFPSSWGNKQPLMPSPAERSLEARFVYTAGTLIILLLLALLLGQWQVAGNAARQLLNDRLQDTAISSAQTVPFFLETGQSLTQSISSEPELQSNDRAVLENALAVQISRVAYFDQLIVMDADRNVLAVYPQNTDTTIFPEEVSGIMLAQSGVFGQTYTIPPEQPGQPARVTFIAAILDANGLPGRVLIGRTSLSANPLTQTLINTLNSMQALDGTGILVDENGRIIYHPQPALVMTDYTGTRTTEPVFVDGTSPDGTRSLIYYQPVLGRSWSVVLTVPAQRAQQIALNIAAPLAVMILTLGVIALASLRIGLKVITNSLQNLATEALRISQGQLDRPLLVEGVDEVGQLRRAFEQMRVSLQERLEELNRLLIVSQGVASSLEMQDAVQPVLEAVLATGAGAVRVVLNQPASREESAPRVYALGPFKESYSFLDKQIITLTQKQERVVLSHLNRSRALELDPAQPAPASLVAVALRHENRYFGVLWAAYDQIRTFSESDTRYISTLAGQAALAAANAHLFLTAEVGRQRLAAILASTPDPVLVTDSRNRLLLANPAAWQTLGTAVGTGEGQPIENLITQKSLLEILATSSPDKLSAEVVLPNGQTYFATASPVVADGRLVGRVCILRDVTHFKELDMMKSEFVNTVSHDLRSPLTLIRGYATMLEMVGTLNDQQRGYAQKIVTGVENMAKLVNNLLDLGRIDVGVGLHLETVPLYEIVERATSSVQLSAAQKNIAFAVNLPEAPSPFIDADPALLQQAMYNLAENAVKYTPPGGSVTVTLKVMGDTMQYEVRDSGIGIPSADLPRLFEKFYRGSAREARAEKGTGLGLAIVKSIVEKHGGRVWVESVVGQGSTFFIHAPLLQPKQDKG